MNRPRLIRGLRIAWTVGCGILCVLLVVLCVRSYWGSQVVGVPVGQKKLIVKSFLGGLLFSWEQRFGKQIATRWAYSGRSLNDINDETQMIARRTQMMMAPKGRYIALSPIERDRTFVFGWNTNDYFTQLWVPHWFLIIPLGIIAVTPVTPWTRLKFSLRTLLIATTLIAVLLGLVMWSIAR